MREMTLAEKCYLVALLGDIPMARREPLFSFAAVDPASGILLGNNFIGTFDDGRLLVRTKATHPALTDR